MKLKIVFTSTYIKTEEVREGTSWRGPDTHDYLRSANPLETKVGQSEHAGSGQSVPLRKVGTRVGRLLQSQLRGVGRPQPTAMPRKADPSALSLDGTFAYARARCSRGASTGRSGALKPHITRSN